MNPDNIKPLGVLGQLHGDQGAGLGRVVAVAGEGVYEVLVVVTGVMPVQPEVGPLHEDVGHVLPCRLVKNLRLQSLKTSVDRDKEI